MDGLRPELPTICFLRNAAMQQCLLAAPTNRKRNRLHEGCCWCRCYHKTVRETVFAFQLLHEWCTNTGLELLVALWNYQLGRVHGYSWGCGEE